MVAEYEIRCSDLLHGLATLKNEAVDLTVTSPPYNIGKEYESQLPLDEYLNWCETWMREIYRVTKPNGAFWLNLGYLEISGKGRAVPIPYLLWDKSPFYLIQEVVWHYGAGVASKKAFSPRNEKWLWFVKNPQAYTFNLDQVRDPEVKYPNQKKNGKLKCNPLGKNPGDVWIIPKVTSGTNRASKERMDHPAQFPVAVIERIILACSNENELILDPFLGSGSTMVTAYLNGRRCLGFEVREDYVKMAQTRMELVANAPIQTCL
ncbi:MAG: site-specific DNA-methyltransferase [Chloroflexota bacterium]|nr:site-specific DNA-methyltransferase [Chloroflexota bacterium]